MKKMLLFLFALLVTVSSNCLKAERTDSIYSENTDNHALPATPVVVKPVFPGGNGAIAQYVRKNLRYPKKALENFIQGKVKIQFTIEADGTVTNAEVIEGICPECDAEALRLVAEMPRFCPGTCNGVPTPVICYLPIRFKLYV